MNELSDIARIIQLAVAPVFLLAGIGAILNVVTARLGRVVDRARTLEDFLMNEHDNAVDERTRSELSVLDRRMQYAQRAIVICSVSALLVCLVVATLFIGVLMNFNVAFPVAVMFILAMFALIVGLAMFLAEVSIATRMLRVRAELFMKQ